MLQRPLTHITLATGGTATWLADLVLHLQSWIGLMGAIIAVISGCMAIAIQWDKFIECRICKALRSWWKRA